MLWEDRLAEVWASPGRAGSGVVVGSRGGVLTARHVVEAAGADGRVLARIVRPGESTATWSRVRVAWEDETWDLALLELENGEEFWHAPSSSLRVVRLGAAAERECESAGFPDAAVQHAAGDEPASVVRQSDHAVGVVAAAGQAKPPADPVRPLPIRWLPLDISTPPPDTEAGWGGMSGAGVALGDGRLIGTIVTAERGRDQRRLYLVPLADVLEQDGAFVSALAALDGPTVAEALAAPRYQRVLHARSLGRDGAPLRIGEVPDLGVFGVKNAGVDGEPPFLDYVPRDDDALLRDRLADAITRSRVLLVVGGSAAGKSRSTAHLAVEVLADHRLLCPREGMLNEVLDLPLDELAPLVVWLDDVEHYEHRALGDTFARLLAAGAVVVATVRRAQLDVLAAPGDLRNPAGDALTDASLVERMDWRVRWSDAERARVDEHVADATLRQAVNNGVSLGAYCVAGPELVRLLRNAGNDDEHPCRYALVRAVLDWERTAVGHRAPLDLVNQLVGSVDLIDGAPDEQELQEAYDWATTPVLGSRRRGAQSMITLDESSGTVAVHDYVLDADQERARRIPDVVWDAALQHAPDPWSRFSIAVAAYAQGRRDIAERAMTPLANAGLVVAMYDLGVLLAERDPSTAQSWYEKAAAAGDTDAMTNLGRLLAQGGDVSGARSWLEKAAAAGNTGAMTNIGRLLEDSDASAAQSWYEKAAAAGNTVAIFNLGVLLEDDDASAAQSWYEKAAAGGDADAMTNLGRLLAEAGDVSAAQSWLERASAAGNTNAMTNLGVLLVAGGDVSAAEPWFESAAAAGNTNAMLGLGLLLVERDPSTAQSWYEKAAAAGNVSAMVHLGRFLVGGDPSTAQSWFERAAAAGNTDAMVDLGLLLVVRGDVSAARAWLESADAAADANADATTNLGRLQAWFEKAAAAGEADAMFNLGVLLAEQDPATAQSWYEKAAAAGNTDAMFNLGVLLAEQDPATAQFWYQKAAASDSEASPQ